jgi:hypothetical protein
LKHASEHTWITLAGEVVDSLHENKEAQSEVTLQVLLIQFSMRAFEIQSSSTALVASDISDLHRVALTVIQYIIQSPFSHPLKELVLQHPLMERLLSDLDEMDSLLQSTLLETITAILKMPFAHAPRPILSPGHVRKGSKDIQAPGHAQSLSKENLADNALHVHIQAPPLLIACLKAGFSSRSSRVIVDSWVTFLTEVLPLFVDTIFQNLIPLVECFCSQIKLVFGQLQSVYRRGSAGEAIYPEPTLISLMNGLEHILASAHERLLNEEGRPTNPRSPDQPQGFFGNMVTGVFTSESQPARAKVANNRLTVLLCFQDTVRACFSIWSWGIYAGGSERQDSSSIASYGYTALRMRNRARRLLEHLFAAEALECLETLAALWCRPPASDFQPQSVMGLLNVLNGSRPKHTIPAIFNAIYSRTNPGALDPSRISSMTSELQDTDLIAFLVEYLRTVEDDAMDEIWNDCMAFLKDVLSNPLPHSHILPTLLECTALLAEKVDNTNFGEQRRMRKELGVRIDSLLVGSMTNRVFRTCF